MSNTQAIAEATAAGHLLPATAENVTLLLETTSDPLADRVVGELLATRNWTELNDRFYRQLAFGTGGLRGRTIGRTVTVAERGSAAADACPEHPCIGTNSMNFRNVSRATQGLANYVRDTHTDHDLPGRPAICIAHDTRYFSREFAEFAARIITDLGCDAHLFDAARSTPQLSFAVRQTGATAGVNLTASHNPPAYNGFKVYFDDGGQIVEPHATGIIKRVNAIRSETPTPVPADERGQIHPLGSANDEAYLDKLETLILDPALVREQPLRVVYSALHGVGGAIIEPLLARLGCEFTTVASQAEPDGAFPTVASPNPENAEALALAIAQAENENADLVIATDPDDDRLGAAARTTTGSPLALLTGNQLGSLMAWYRAMKTFETNRLTPATAATGVIIKTFVTTDLQSAIAKKFGLRCVETLTGFKYIGAKLKRYEDTDTHFVFGGEESHGYSGADFVRDKDGNAAAAMLCEVAAYARSQDLTLHELLDTLYAEFGYHHERSESLTLEGAEGAAQIRALVESYAAAPPTDLAGRSVTEVRNFATEDIYDTEGDLIPKEAMLTFALTGGYRVAVRPSGTEPKIKYYLFGKADPVPADQIPATKARVAAGIDALWTALFADARDRVPFT
ncbi:MAG: phospho-sugar mutase [Chthoniobacterales bacterium]